MKLKKKSIKKKINKTSLYLLKYKIYNNYYKIQNLSLLNLLKNVEFSLKQSLKLIVNYTLNNRTILFLGFPYLNKKKHVLNLKHSNHVFLPKIIWVKGYTKKYLFKNIFRSNKIPDLIVFFDKQKTDYLILKELEDLNIPIIIFDNSMELKTFNHYTIPGNLEKKKT